MLKRNDKCHCGSGKKYKKCCIDKDKKNSFELKKIMKLKESYLKAHENVMNYASQREDFEKIKDEASKLFFLKKMECPQEILPVFNTFMIKDFLLEENRSNLIVEYYNKFKSKLSSLEVNILYNTILSYISLYSVESVDDYKIKLKDLFTNEIIEVQDNVLGNTLVVKSVYIANIVKIGGINILTNILLEISAKNVLENIVCDLIEIYDNYKEDYETKQEFLRRNCLLFYYHILQIILPEIVEEFEKMINESLSLKESNEISSDDDIQIVANANKKEELNLEKQENCNVKFTKEVIDKIDLKLKDEVLVMLASLLKDKAVSKVAEAGWVSAVEYHIKKESGESATQSEIAKKYNVSSSTLGRRYKVVKEFSN